MNTQEAYEQIRAWFSDPEHTLAVAGGMCKFRIFTLDGPTQKCAVGCLLPDELYDPEMDRGGTGACDLVAWDNRVMSFFEDINIDFLDEAQRLHDSIAVRGDSGPFKESFLRQLDNLARNHDLEVKA